MDNSKETKTLFACVSASLILHLLAAILLQSQSLWFPSHPTEPHTGLWVDAIQKSERDQILKEAFEPVEDAPVAIQTKPEPKKEKEEPLIFTGLIPALQDPSHFPTPFSPPFAAEKWTEQTSKTPRSIAFTSEMHQDLFAQLSKELIVPTPAQITQTMPPRPRLHPEKSVPLTAPKLTLRTEAPLFASAKIPTELPQLQPLKAPAPRAFPALPSLPTLDELETSSFSDSFDADLVFIEDEGEYIFALTLVPRIDLELPKIKQHYTFLIDRSNSIQKDRLAATKNAVYKALSELSPEDTFNIYAFDNKIDKLFGSPMSPNTRSLDAARNFLDHLQLGSFFFPADLFKPLFLTLPTEVKEDEVHTAILLTDGETLSKRSTQRALLNDWTHLNNGKVALYTMGMGTDARLSTLETASLFNKGKLALSTTKRGMKRKLLKLMRSIGSPIAKNIVGTAISRAPKGQIELYPKTAQMPHLYLDQPYVILGKTRVLDDFILFIQGRLKDRWMHIKKTISFIDAKKGGDHLKAEWALQKAHENYTLYLQDNNQGHLVEAKLLLEPFHIPLAIE